MRRLRALLRWWGGWRHRERLQGVLVALLVALPLSTVVDSAFQIWSDGARGPATNDAMGADFTTLTFLLLLGLYALCSRTVRALRAAALWTFAWAWGEGFFVGPVHRFFLEWSVYPGFLKGVQQAEPNANFAKLLCLFVVGVLLLGLVARRRTRSFDRIFVALMFWSVYLTAFLFHWVTITGIREARVQGEVALRLIVEAPERIVQPMCAAAGARCFVGSLAEPAPRSGDEVLDAILARQIAWMAAAPAKPMTVMDWSNDRRSIFSLALHRTGDGRYRVAVDGVRYREIIYLYQGLYAALANTAHLLWLGGGFYLLGWHRRRLRARAGIRTQGI